MGSSPIIPIKDSHGKSWRGIKTESGSPILGIHSGQLEALRVGAEAVRITLSQYYNPFKVIKDRKPLGCEG